MGRGEREREGERGGRKGGRGKEEGVICIKKERRRKMKWFVYVCEISAVYVYL